MDVDVKTDNYSIQGDYDDCVVFKCPYNARVWRKMRNVGAIWDKEDESWTVDGYVAVELENLLEDIWG